MRYLPISATKELTEFPSNEEMIAAGLEPIKVVIKSRLSTREVFALGELAQVEELDASGKPTGRKYTNLEVSSKSAVSVIKSWNLKDLDTGEAVPVTEDAISDLMLDDFQYLQDEIAKAVNGKAKPSPAQAAGEVAGEGVSAVEEAVAPKTDVTEAEKN